jgi:hypothetical protein
MAPADSTFISVKPNPIELKTTVTGNFVPDGSTNLKFPLLSVKVPADPSFNVTETDPMASPPDAFLTLPVTTWLCAKTNTGESKNSNATKQAYLFISI